MSNAAQKRINARIAKTLLDYLKSLSTTDTPPTKAQLNKPYLPEIDPDFVRETESLIATALLLGMDHALRKMDMADLEIPISELTFEEATSFMRSRIPVTKAEWIAFEPMLRFRAFTVARLSQLDYIDAARQVLSNAIGSGKGVAETYKQWQTLQTLIGDDAMRLRPGYWENVFRTNTQTAYTAGKLMQFKDRPPPAWRLLVIEDSRTSTFCRALLREGQTSLVLPSDHPFWGKYGYPPYHFQCRTGLQAVYKAQIDDGVTMDSFDIKSTTFQPMDGFGGNPLDKESWWMMTEKMALRAAHYDIFNDVEEFAKDNGLYNFSLNLVRGVDMERLDGTIYTARKAGLARPLQKEVYAAKILEENGHRVFFTPENRTSSNYDAIINGRLGEFKNPESFNKIIRRLNEADGQRASIVCLTPPTENHSIDDAIKKVEGWFKSSQTPILHVDTVMLIWDGLLKIIRRPL